MLRWEFSLGERCCKVACSKNFMHDFGFMILVYNDQHLKTWPLNSVDPFSYLLTTVDSSCRMLCSILVVSLSRSASRNCLIFFSLWLSQDGRTALMFAAVGGRSEMVKLLVHRHKATVDEKDPVRLSIFTKMKLKYNEKRERSELKS